MLKGRFENIATYLQHQITNAASESLNAKVQWVMKYTARGFRNKQNFIHAIYFHCGGLDLAHPLNSRKRHPGNSLLRFLLVEVAQATVRSDPNWRRQFMHLAMRRERRIAEVAMARKLGQEYTCLAHPEVVR